LEAEALLYCEEFEALNAHHNVRKNCTFKHPEFLNIYWFQFNQIRFLKNSVQANKWYLGLKGFARSVSVEIFLEKGY
jgi:hypothetical protein